MDLGTAIHVSTVYCKRAKQSPTLTSAENPQWTKVGGVGGTEGEMCKSALPNGDAYRSERTTAWAEPCCGRGAQTATRSLWSALPGRGSFLGSSTCIHPWSGQSRLIDRVDEPWVWDKVLRVKATASSRTSRVVCGWWRSTAGVGLLLLTRTWVFIGIAKTPGPFFAGNCFSASIA